MSDPRRRLCEDPADPQAWCDLAHLAKPAGRRHETIAAFGRASAILPDDAAIAGIWRTEVSSAVPRWHFPMMRDKVRNDAYATAIRLMIRPEHNVLEIGTGSGLLAMLCARAGARQVTTCEMVPEIAAAARRVIDDNGLGERIRVLSKRSQEIEVGIDLPEAGDVLISEILSNDVVGEGALAAVTDARARLLNSDAVIIPAIATVRIALVAADDMDRLFSAGSYDGLTLQAFDRLRPTVLSVPESCAVTPFSDPHDVFVFDFAGAAPFRHERRVLDMRAIAPGRCHGVVQWIKLDLGAGVTFENAPFSANRSHWLPTFYPFPAAVEVKPGDVVRVLAIHDTQNLLIFREGGPGKSP